MNEYAVFKVLSSGIIAKVCYPVSGSNAQRAGVATQSITCSINGNEA